jgi:hypothetical protein
MWRWEWGMANSGSGHTAPRDAWLAFRRFVRRFYLFCGTAALLICGIAIVSSSMGWMNFRWSTPNVTEIAGVAWSVVTWLAVHSGEVIRVVSFGLLSWALFLAAMKMETIFKIVRGFNEARSPITQLRTSVDDIKSTIHEVAGTVTGVKESAREFDKNMGVLKEFNERFKALSDQVIGLQEEAVSQRTGAIGALPAGGLEAAAADDDEQNWEELRTIWKSNNQRLEAIIKNKLVGAKQRKYDNYPRTDYTVIINRLYDDDVLTQTTRDKSIELHRMFMSYRSRRKPVTDKVVGEARLLGEQLNHLMDTERIVKDDSGPNGQAGLAKAPESHGDLAGASAGTADDRPDRPTGA